MLRMNFNSRDIVPLNGSARTTDPPPDHGRESADRDSSGRADSATDRIYIDAPTERGSFPPSDYPRPGLCRTGKSSDHGRHCRIQRRTPMPRKSNVSGLAEYLNNTCV